MFSTRNIPALPVSQCFRTSDKVVPTRGKPRRCFWLNFLGHIGCASGNAMLKVLGCYPRVAAVVTQTCGPYLAICAPKGRPRPRRSPRRKRRQRRVLHVLPVPLPDLIRHKKSTSSPIDVDSKACREELSLYPSCSVHMSGVAIVIHSVITNGGGCYRRAPVSKCYTCRPHPQRYPCPRMRVFSLCNMAPPLCSAHLFLRIPDLNGVPAGISPRRRIQLRGRSIRPLARNSGERTSREDWRLRRACDTL